MDNYRVSRFWNYLKTTVKSVTRLGIDPIGHGEVITTNVEVCYVMFAIQSPV